MLRSLLAGAMGAALAYFLDPDRGKRRRNMARDRLFSVARRSANRIGKTARYTAGNAYGLTQRAARLNSEPEPLPNDAALSHKVQSELFRDPAVPKGKINVNAEEGVVVLRGEVQRQEQIRALEERVRDIDGVLGVQNLLHLPNTPPPMC
jgi:osmotically-inducible protein OsmY